jgi:selenocysteine lyase/cysteine desulfurase
LEAKSRGVLNPEIQRELNAKFPVETLRAAFPALSRSPEFVFFDNAAGAQCPQIVLDAVNHPLLDCNVPRGGRYPTSRAVHETIRPAPQSAVIW